MARGITQEQVNRAADALLTAGENPTVEKIRAALGTGSPNTVTRMLDTWRVNLGERLHRLQSLPGIPADVGQAMAELWRVAVEHADLLLQARLSDDRAALTAAEARLADERTRWAATLAEAEMAVAQAQARRELVEHACATLDGQLRDSHALRDDVLQQRDRVQAITDQQRAEIEALRAEQALLGTAMRIEREQHTAHMRDAENRAHQEVDRARQETKLLPGRAAALEAALSQQKVVKASSKASKAKSPARPKATERRKK
ncbi:DNA-binding protein [Dyella sp. GSA-30]|uniref:DNA-binding protein n=1 Tax=Dyella sp. GSA-30 TaxID=2994496 RepID=UPI002490F7A5|nr:DNA-binding protein [Dyella sp. GSA-30]BDU21582.1 hypothetical protein DYGSA30_30390 [Dyella sp. GSA-30]